MFNLFLSVVTMSISGLVENLVAAVLDIVVSSFPIFSVILQFVITTTTGYSLALMSEKYSREA